MNASFSKKQKYYYIYNYNYFTSTAVTPSPAYLIMLAFVSHSESTADLQPGLNITEVKLQDPFVGESQQEAGYTEP